MTIIWSRHTHTHEHLIDAMKRPKSCVVLFYTSMVCDLEEVDLEWRALLPCICDLNLKWIPIYVTINYVEITKPKCGINALTDFLIFIMYQYSNIQYIKSTHLSSKQCAAHENQNFLELNVICARISKFLKTYYS